MHRMIRRGVNAFSLVEVVLALGLAAFVLTALLATFPAGLGAEGASRDESRATHMAGMVFGALREGPFGEMSCYGITVDLSQSSPGVQLGADAPATGAVVIRPGAGGDYLLQLRFTPQYRAGRVEAATVFLAVTPRNRPETVYHFCTVIGNYGS